LERTNSAVPPLAIHGLNGDTIEHVLEAVRGKKKNRSDDRAVRNLTANRSERGTTRLLPDELANDEWVRITTPGSIPSGRFGYTFFRDRIAIVPEGGNGAPTSNS